MGVCLSWSKGLSKVLDNPNEELSLYDPKFREPLIKQIGPYRDMLRGGTLYANLFTGLTVTCSGALFGFLMYKNKVKNLYAMIWFGMVSCFTLVWMVTAIVFYTELDEVAGQIKLAEVNHVPSPLTTIHKWGKDSSGTTAMCLIVVPTFLFLFLSFVAYRLHSKLEIFGNENPDIVATETSPASWFDRKAGAEGGTWEREPDEQDTAMAGASSVMDNGGETEKKPTTGLFLRKFRRSTTDGAKSQSDQEEEVFEAQAVMVNEGPALKAGDSMTNGWGSWLEDVFDYTF